MTLQDSLLLSQGQYQKELVQTEGTELALMKILPFKTLSGTSYVWNKVSKLPDVPFRAVGERIRPSKIEYEGGAAFVSIMTDEAIFDTSELQEENFSQKLEMVSNIKVKSILNKYQLQAINGNTDIDYKGFDGLLKICHPKQVVSATPDIYMDMMALRDKVSDKLPSVFVMTKSTLRILENQNREAITFSRNEFGKKLAMFGYSPIIALEDNEMPFNQVICMNPDSKEGVTGLTTKSGIDVRQLGESTESASVHVRFEYLCGIAVLTDKCLAVRK